MKKLFIGVAAVAMFSLASCKKEYTCECTVMGQTQSVKLEKQKKSDAEDKCDAAESTYKQGDPDATCELK